MNQTTRFITVAILVALTILCQPTEAQQEVNQRAFKRHWTCHATIFLVGTNHQYTPSNWKMKTGDQHAVWGDRERSCKQYIQAEMLTGSIWDKLTLTPGEQNRVCREGRGVFRIEYGFDRRPKSWSFTQSVPAPPCDCELNCDDGYDLDTTSSPGNPRCVRRLCQGAAAGIPNDRFGPHDNGIGIWNGDVYHHQPVRRGSCTFADQGTWTPWLDRDNPGGNGDFEDLAGFRQTGQACANPKKIECRLVGTNQLVQTGMVNGRERYLCDVTRGGICDNRQQSSGITCSDYEVRFLCP